MEDTKVALDSFMSSQSESVSVQVTADGPSYLSLIKSRYAQTVNIKAAVNVPANPLYEAWQKDFMSNVNVLPHVPCGEHDSEVAEEEDELEHITLECNTQGNNTSDNALRMSSKLKVTRTNRKHNAYVPFIDISSHSQVDNFYIDGENEPLDDLDFCGYMPSGVNNSALFDNADEALEELDMNEAEYEETQLHAESEHHTVIIPDNLPSHDQEGEINKTIDSAEAPSLSTANMARLQRAYQTEQSRIVETLSCSESSVAGQEKDDHELNDDSAIVDNSTEESEMLGALKAFQEFSPRYRDIQTSELLQSIHNVNTTNVNIEGNNGEVVRWYDDVEEFVEE